MSIIVCVSDLLINPAQTPTNLTQLTVVVAPRRAMSLMRSCSWRQMSLHLLNKVRAVIVVSGFLPNCDRTTHDLNGFKINKKKIPRKQLMSNLINENLDVTRCETRRAVIWRIFYSFLDWRFFSVSQSSKIRRWPFQQVVGLGSNSCLAI